MVRFKALLKLHFKAALMGVGFASGNKKKRISSAAVMAMLGLLMLYIGGMYAVMLFSMLKTGFELAVCIMALLAMLMSFMLSLFASQGVIFGHKDLDILFSLPLNMFSILLSKLLAVYLENLIISTCITVPSMVLYQMKTGFSVFTTIGFVIALLILPLVATILSVIFGFLLAFIKSKAKGGRVFGIVVSFTGFALLMGGIFYLQTAMMSLLAKPENALNAIYKYFYPIRFMGEGVFEGNILSLVLFIVTAIAPFLIIVWLLSMQYRRLVTSTLVQRTVKTKMNLSTVKAQGSMAALVKKELNKYFGIQILVFNTGFGFIMMIGAAVAAFIFKDELDQILLQYAKLIPEIGFMLSALIALIFGFMASTCYFTSVATSLESKQMWLIKSLPISTEKVFLSQIIANAVLAVIPTAACTLAINLLFSINILTTVLSCLFAVSLLVPGWLAGIMINMLFPRMEAISDVAVVKQSAAAMLGMFVNWGIVIIPGVVLVLAVPAEMTIVFMAIATAVLVAVSCILWKIIATKGVKIFYSL